MHQKGTSLTFLAVLHILKTVPLKDKLNVFPKSIIFVLLCHPRCFLSYWIVCLVQIFKSGFNICIQPVDLSSVIVAWRSFRCQIQGLIDKCKRGCNVSRFGLTNGLSFKTPWVPAKDGKVSRNKVKSQLKIQFQKFLIDKCKRSCNAFCFGLSNGLSFKTPWVPAKGK